MLGFLLYWTGLVVPNFSDTPFMVAFDNSESFNDKDLAQWLEISDTVRPQGMSKAALVLQKTFLFQRGVLFVVLNPQPNGACFAGVKRSTEAYDFTDYTGIELSVRAQGLKNWKLVLNHDMLNLDPAVTYEGFFALNSTVDFSTLQVPFTEMKPYYRGKSVEAPPIQLDKVIALGLQGYGGVYEVNKQSGPGTLEMKYIAAY